MCKVVEEMLWFPPSHRLLTRSTQGAQRAQCCEAAPPLTALLTHHKGIALAQLAAPLPRQPDLAHTGQRFQQLLQIPLRSILWQALQDSGAAKQDRFTWWKGREGEVQPLNHTRARESPFITAAAAAAATHCAPSGAAR